MDRLQLKLENIKTEVSNNVVLSDAYQNILSFISPLISYLEPHLIKVKQKSLELDEKMGDLKYPILTSSVLVLSLFVFGFLGTKSNNKASSKSSKKPKGKKSTLTKAQKSNQDIQSVLDTVEETFVPQIEEYIKNYKELSHDDVQYKFKYFEEMLLKELLKLDAIDVNDNDILRDNRRKVIKFIQDHQKRLDVLMKEISKGEN